MSVLDEFMSDAKVLANKASRKVSETYEISKLKAERLRIQNRIDASYRSLGEAVYANKKNGTDIMKIFDTLVAQLDEDFDKISAIYEEIEKVKTIYGSYSENEEYDDDYEEEIENEEECGCCECEDEECECCGEEEVKETPASGDIELEAD